MLWQPAENSLNAGSIYGAGEKAHRLDHALFTEHCTSEEGGWTNFWEQDRRQVFFLHLSWKAATHPCAFSLWSHELHLPFCTVTASAQSPSPCLAPVVCVKTCTEELDKLDLTSTYLSHFLPVPNILVLPTWLLPPLHMLKNPKTKRESSTWKM